jgi:hypothetical protein
LESGWYSWLESRVPKNKRQADEEDPEERKEKLERQCENDVSTRK